MVEKKSFMPYVLPVITIVAVVILSLWYFNGDNNTAGFAVLENMDQVTSKIRVELNDMVVIPKGALVEVRLDNVRASMTLEEFITKTGKEFEIKDGANPLIEYWGEGYTGNYVYELDLSDFGIVNVKEKDNHLLTIRVSYGDKVISQSQNFIEK